MLVQTDLTRVIFNFFLIIYSHHHLSIATTVASTMIFAKLAGIRVFATGGIGGVHRGAESTMDISADLDELSRTNVAVVSSGIKSILDIHRTLEVLETKGVPVYGYQSSEFPAFFTNNSGIKSPLIAAGVLDIARAMACQDDLGRYVRKYVSVSIVSR